MLQDDLNALFESWLAAHGAAVLKIARTYAFSKEDVQDLAQDILFQCWVSLPQFEGRATVSTWFYRIAINTALTWSRNDRRRKTRQKPLFQIDELAEPNRDVVQSITQDETIKRLYAAIHQLSRTDSALVLLYLENLTYREIADVLGISESNVGVKLNRAKRALGQMMEEEKHDT
ncbi:MAG: RNA polymerase sigma factor [Planctomycetaceae bacterium]